MSWQLTWDSNWLSSGWGTERFVWRARGSSLLPWMSFGVDRIRVHNDPILSWVVATVVVHVQTWILHRWRLSGRYQCRRWWTFLRCWYSIRQREFSHNPWNGTRIETLLEPQIHSKKLKQLTNILIEHSRSPEGLGSGWCSWDMFMIQLLNVNYSMLPPLRSHTDWRIYRQMHYYQFIKVFSYSVHV